MASSDKEWSPTSWQSLVAKQQPDYSEEKKEELKKVLHNIKRLPPLVHAGEVDLLKSSLAKAVDGRAFVLQGGDCAERFQDCTAESIERKLRIMLQMSLVLIWKAKKPVVRILRGAGQYAKPRSSPVEKLKDGRTVPSFRGDNINGFGTEEREHDPKRLLSAYFHSATTTNYIRALIDGGFTSLDYPHKFDLDNVKCDKTLERYHALLESLGDGLDFLRAVGGHKASTFSGAPFSTSHECLVLDYESALTSKCNDKYYNLGAHFLWIGDRTRALDGAHVEYASGISNPVGLKCGPSLQADELGALVKKLNAKREPGKLILITRYGSKKVAELLPGHIKAVQATGVPVVWLVDPMHGNTFMDSTDKVKTRQVEDIWSEVQQAARIHHELGSHLGGVHLELTGENVTECLGGSQELKSGELAAASYTTYCDPRLNYTQSLDIAFSIADWLAKGNGKQPKAAGASA